MHFVIPVAPGGGVDGTAREIGRTLDTLGLAGTVSFENVGGGSDRALGLFVENEARFRSALLVHSTPLVIRNVQGLFPLGFRNLTPIAGLVADYGIFVVRGDDPVDDWKTVLQRLSDDPSGLIVGGVRRAAASITSCWPSRSARPTSTPAACATSPTMAAARQCSPSSAAR